MARLDSRRRWSSMTANPPQMVSLRGKGAGSGVIHAPGVPGAPPLREISIDEVTCADGSISSAVRATRMGNTDSAPALDRSYVSGRCLIALLSREDGVLSYRPLCLHDSWVERVTSGFVGCRSVGRREAYRLRRASE